MYHDVLFVETFTKTPEKEFLESRGFKNMASEALKILAKKIADYIKYRLEIKGDILLDYDDDVDEVFIRIKLQSHENSTAKAKLEREIISKILEGFSSDEIENITIMVE